MCMAGPFGMFIALEYSGDSLHLGYGEQAMRAAVAALRQQQPAHMVVAGPVAASSTCDEFKTEVDDIVCAARPEPFYAVGLWYENFSPTSDAEVRDLLARAAQWHATTVPAV